VEEIAAKWIWGEEVRWFGMWWRWIFVPFVAVWRSSGVGGGVVTMSEDEKLLKEAKKMAWEDRLAHKNIAAVCDGIMDPKDPRLREFGNVLTPWRFFHAVGYGCDDYLKI
jgi:hypothetical protein